MNRMQGEFTRDGLVVIAVNVDHEHADAERFLRRHTAQFRIVYDPDGLLPEKFGVRGMPTSFLIDRNGHVQSRHEGFEVVLREGGSRRYASWRWRAPASCCSTQPTWARRMRQAA